MTTLQKTLIATALAAAIGLGTYEARQASRLRTEVKTLRQQAVSRPEPARTGTLASLQGKVESLEAQKNELAGALARANADKVRLENEREQAKRSAALYKELVEQTSPKDVNPTNAYPTPRHVWTAFGKLGRLGALSKQDQSKLSPEEKSALEAARMKALLDLPTLVKAAKQFNEGRPAEADPNPEEVMDMVACMLYGALDLDVQQFNQVYGVMQKIQQECKEKGLSKETPDPQRAEAAKQIMEEFKTETQALLRPDQAEIFKEVVTHFQVEPHSFGYNFGFSN